MSFSFRPLLSLVFVLLLASCEDRNTEDAVDSFAISDFSFTLPVESICRPNIRFQASFTESQNRYPKYTIDYGDGTTELLEQKRDLLDKFHEYLAPGNYEVTILDEEKRPKETLMLSLPATMFRPIYSTFERWNSSEYPYFEIQLTGYREDLIRDPEINLATVRIDYLKTSDMASVTREVVDETYRAILDSIPSISTDALGIVDIFWEVQDFTLFLSGQCGDGPIIADTLKQTISPVEQPAITPIKQIQFTRYYRNFSNSTEQVTLYDGTKILFQWVDENGNGLVENAEILKGNSTINLDTIEKNYILYVATLGSRPRPTLFNVDALRYNTGDSLRNLIFNDVE